MDNLSLNSVVFRIMEWAYLPTYSPHPSSLVSEHGAHPPAGIPIFLSSSVIVTPSPLEDFSVARSN